MNMDLNPQPPPALVLQMKFSITHGLKLYLLLKEDG